MVTIDWKLVKWEEGKMGLIISNINTEDYISLYFHYSFNSFSSPIDNACSNYTNKLVINTVVFFHKFCFVYIPLSFSLNVSQSVIFFLSSLLFPFLFLCWPHFYSIAHSFIPFTFSVGFFNFLHYIFLLFLPIDYCLCWSSISFNIFVLLFLVLICLLLLDDSQNHIYPWTSKVTKIFDFLLAFHNCRVFAVANWKLEQM